MLHVGRNVHLESMFVLGFGSSIVVQAMESGVHEALSEICASHGSDWKEILARMRKEGRYHAEVY